MQCPVCGAENESGATFCYRCGSKLPAEPASSGPTAQPGRRETPAFGTPMMTVEREETGARVYDAPSAPVQPTAYQVPSYNVSPGAFGAGQIAQQSSNALLSMILGILSLVLYTLFFCVGIAPLASFLAIPAVIVGNKARREIRATQGRLTGDGMALGGIITGWVTIGLSILAIVLFVLAIIGIAALGSLD